METMVKLTDNNLCTYRREWTLGKAKSLLPVDDPLLNTKQVFHTYRSKELALLLNPLHANFSNPRLFRAEGTVVVEDMLLAGFFTLTLLEELACPFWYEDIFLRGEIALRFASLCLGTVNKLTDSPSALKCVKRLKKEITEAKMSLKRARIHSILIDDSVYASAKAVVWAVEAIEVQSHLVGDANFLREATLKPDIKLPLNMLANRAVKEITKNEIRSLHGKERCTC